MDTQYLEKALKKAIELKKTDGPDAAYFYLVGILEPLRSNPYESKPLPASFYKEDEKNISETIRKFEAHKEAKKEEKVEKSPSWIIDELYHNTPRKRIDEHIPKAKAAPGLFEKQWKEAVKNALWINSPMKITEIMISINMEPTNRGNMNNLMRKLVQSKAITVEAFTGNKKDGNRFSHPLHGQKIALTGNIPPGELKQ